RGGSASPGEYREKQNYVINGATKEVIYTPPPASEVPSLMNELVSWLNAAKGVHPVLRSGVAQFQLVHIHPFRDGNGRTSRLLSTLCLYRDGFDFKRLFTLSEFYDRDRQAFYNAIQGVRDQDMDLTGWLEYFTRGLATQLIEVKDRGEKIIRADLAVRRFGLNGRQSEALKFLAAHRKLTLQDFEKLCPEVNRRTLQRDLKDLLEKKLICEVGAGSTDPTRHYVWAGYDGL
ncbi:MAG TPA: Fic family protein, partial [Tichowtungia sp.]|nr:Fic family protein [Tichowtungia sp.]